ncbi:carbonic anhydrase [Roseomonas eburnea]|uniref:Carbonic anhydrase n=1 Tax=Neoroseomonas eburnea TaxID=1346889 RepID=A0A9X9XCR5_9PROT|nr:carbonic anhydrase [Neoroseomonas eburnea]MBR0681501.1 carbonic anhydrase [Neoroseomonas eburnea]
MDELIAGYRRFRQETWPQQRARFEELAAKGQRPRTMVIACSDSRVDPQMIFSAGPGELFVLRNVANLVPPYMPDALFHGTSAAVEFAVRVLQVERIVVMGHALCGGVRALLQGAPPEAQDFVAGWMGIAQRARDVALRCDNPVERQEVAEHEAVRISLTNLLTFPWVEEAIAAGRLTLHGAHFGVATGRLVLVPAEGAPVPAA